MPDVESTNVSQEPHSNAWRSAITVVQEAETPFIPPGAHAMTIVVEFPPGDPGTPAHRHSGGAFHSHHALRTRQAHAHLRG
jgi:hypothetical protein